MKTYQNFYINGQWRPATGKSLHEVINPANGEVAVLTAEANGDDVNAAVAAAKAAFPAWSSTPAKERRRLMYAIAEEMDQRAEDMAEAISLTMGCPKSVALPLQVEGPSGRVRSYGDRALELEKVDERKGFAVVKEAVGVCVLINPWNYPISQLIGKLAPALAAGCTVIAKPAEQTPLQDIIMAEIMDKVGLPPGVFNLLLGRGSEIGPLLCSHPDVDMVSFTGSTRAGRMIADYASPTIKRVTLELGGKSPYIVTADADLEAGVKDCVAKVMWNTGQSCNAPTRLIVPNSRYEEAVSVAKEAAERFAVGDPCDPNVKVGPLSSENQRKIVTSYMEKGIAEGARLVCGGPGYPEGLEHGAYVKPTVFADVSNDMCIAREEIFGPVVSMIGYDTIEEAIAIANDTVYGLSSNVYAKDRDSAFAIARQIRAGQCFIQGGGFNGEAPFGGYKQSGNGREWGDEGLHEYCEIKAIIN